MALINLICPHCSGKFEMDTERPLQSFWVCPYCGNRSLMQKSDDTIRLRGIIPGRPVGSAQEQEDELLANEATTQAKPGAAPRQISASSSPASPIAAFLSGKPLAEEPVQVQPESAAPTESKAEPSRPAPTAPMPERYRSLAEIIAETSSDTPDAEATEVAPAPAPAASSEPAPAPAAPPPAPQIAPPPATAAPAAWIPAPVVPAPAAPSAPFRLSNHSAPTPSASQAAMPDSLDRLCKLAQDAAASHDFPLFNAYSRQAIDCQPKDPRMYALRAELIEEADGFARATWTEPGWSLLTPRRKASIIAQHLYNFNTAIKFSRVNQQPELIKNLSWQLVRQAIDFFTEQAELRCKGKPYQGQLKGHDLKLLPAFIDALALINSQTCPIGHVEIQKAVRDEISKAPPSIARHFKRI